MLLPVTGEDTGAARAQSHPTAGAVDVIRVVVMIGITAALAAESGVVGTEETTVIVAPWDAANVVPVIAPMRSPKSGLRWTTI